MSNRGHYVGLTITTDQERNKLFQYFLTFTALRPLYHVWTHCLRSTLISFPVWMLMLESFFPGLQI